MCEPLSSIETELLVAILYYTLVSISGSNALRFYTERKFSLL